MEISTYETWMEWTHEELRRRAVAEADYIKRDPEYLPRQREDQRDLEQQRSGLLVRFPRSVVTEGLSDEYDFACRWCWRHIGPMNGPCLDAHSYYPACPLVLATEYLERGEYQGKEFVKKRYQHPADHEHEGRWTYLWFGKTGYDYGFGEYYFANETDRAQFLTAFPTFTWDASWDEEEPN